MTLTLDEAIKHEEELINEYEKNAKHIREKMKSEISLSNADDFDKYARQHGQLVEWLKELKKFREQEPREDWCDVPSYEMSLEQARQAVRDLRKFVMDNHILPKLQPCEDAISKKAVLDLTREAGKFSLCAMIEDLPPVAPTSSKMEQVEQEPILDKIRAEIYEYEEELFHRTENYTDYAVARHCLDIIDKYRAESEE